MKAKDIYNMEVEKEETSLWQLNTAMGCNFLPELGFDVANLSQFNDKVVIKTHINYNFDHRRIWSIKSVWFDNNPVMIIKNAGREGDDYSKRHITNREMFLSMLKYLQELKIRNSKHLSIYDEDEEIEGLEEMYGSTLEEIKYLDSVKEKEVVLKQFLKQRLDDFYNYKLGFDTQNKPKNKLYYDEEEYLVLEEKDNRDNYKFLGEKTYQNSAKEFYIYKRKEE